MPEMQMLLALLLSGLIGVSLGLLGGGGSILAVPILVYVAGFETKAAIMMSLAVVGATSLVASFLHYRKGNVDFRIAALFGGAGMLGAFFGAKLTHLFAATTLMLFFAALMLTIGSLMLRRKQYEENSGKPNVPIVLLIGLCVGGLTGFIGVGGGFLIVPALVLLAKLPMRVAIGTSLLIIAFNSISGMAGHWSHNDLPAVTTFAFAAIAMLGAIVGEKTARQSPPTALRKWFAIFVIAVGIFLVARNVAVLI